MGRDPGSHLSLKAQRGRQSASAVLADAQDPMQPVDFPNRRCKDKGLTKGSSEKTLLAVKLERCWT